MALSSSLENIWDKTAENFVDNEIWTQNSIFGRLNEYLVVY